MTEIAVDDLVGYHEDISLAEKIFFAEAVIIDMGTATDNPKDVHPLNRSYGGNNDLISAGLLIYKMATGRNLFNDDETKTLFRKGKVKKEREKAYAKPELKYEYICKVRREVKDPVFADMIVDLLNEDLWVQPRLEDVEEAMRMF